FSVAHGGLTDIRQHGSGAQHCRNLTAQKTQASVSQFFIPQSSLEIDMVTAAELTQVYHIARHNLSYNSADCSHKLNQKCLADSKTKKITFERTKAQAIVKDVLAQKAVGDVARALTLDKPFPFSVQTDASNKGNWKVFPLAIHYFTITSKMLDFIENPDESAARIAALMEQLLEKFGV
uniref:Uncharacterized protein n=1 Tax=Poecilia formosa TaxID=48698 RepID=A0A096M281_POEFO